MVLITHSYKLNNVALGICITTAVTVFIALIADLQSSVLHIDGLNNPSGPRRRLTEAVSSRASAPAPAVSQPSDQAAATTGGASDNIAMSGNGSPSSQRSESGGSDVAPPTALSKLAELDDELRALKEEIARLQVS